VFAGLFAILVPLAAAEAARLGRDCGVRTPTALTMIVALVMYLTGAASLLVSDSTLAAGMAMLGPAVGFAIAAIGLATSRKIDGAFTGAATIAGIAIWTGLLPVFWLSAFRDHGAWLAVGLVLVVKSGDIGAYFTGMTLGRHKLIPWLSPKKTIEGGVGALVFGGLAGTGLAALTAEQPASMSLSMTAGVVGGVSLAFVGGLGDLLESLLKRAAGAKDSGSVLPGMGGVLDVLDSPLVAGPVAWLVLRLGTGG
jgi:phosphatidate cytidylyltransferase